MSPMRHRWLAVVGSAATCALLSGCFGSGGQEPTATHRTRHHPAESSVPTDSSSASGPTESSSPPAPGSVVLRFSPRSGGKHLDDCQKLVPGDDPAEFVYYPVLLKATTAVSLDSVATDHTQGVVDAGSWVAPAASTPETGTFKGWPPTYVAHDSNLHWSGRVPTAGAPIDAGVSYNVFLRLQVDPTPGDSSVNGLEFAYHDSDGSHSQTWKATTTFSMDC